jgi:hypothetical protein
MQTKDLQRSVGDRYATKGHSEKIVTLRALCVSAFNTHFLSFHPMRNLLASKNPDFRFFHFPKTAL